MQEMITIMKNFCWRVRMSEEKIKKEIAKQIKEQKISNKIKKAIEFIITPFWWVK